MRISDVRVPTPTLAVSIARGTQRSRSPWCWRADELLAAIGIAGLLASALWIVLFPTEAAACIPASSR